MKKGLKILKGESEAINQEGQTKQWLKRKGQKDKQQSTNQYTGNLRLINTNITKTRGELRCSGRVRSSCSTYYIMPTVGSKNTPSNMANIYNCIAYDWSVKDE